MAKLTKAQLLDQIEIWKRKFSADDTIVNASIIQEMYGHSLQPKDHLFETARLVMDERTPEVIAQMKNPPEPVSKSVAFNLNLEKYPSAFFESLAQWAEKNELLPGKPDLLTPSQKSQLAIVLGNSLFLYAAPKDHPTSAPANLYVKRADEHNVYEQQRGTEKERFQIQMSEFHRAMVAGGITLDHRHVKDIVTTWEIGTERTKNDMRTMKHRDLHNDEDEPCLYYSPHYPDDGQEFPTIMEFLERTSDQEALAAWIYGVFTDKYAGRQVIWMHGTEGGEGKSVFWDCILERLFGDAGHAVITNNSSKSEFALSSLPGAIVAHHPDCNNGKFLLSETLKAVSGGGRDKNLVNAKFKDAVSMPLRCRVVVCSNSAPWILAKANSISRVIYITVSTFEGTPKAPAVIQEAMEEELNGFLAYGEACWDKMMEDSGGGLEAIALLPKTLELTKALIMSNDPIKEEVFRQNFKVDKGGSITMEAFKDIMDCADCGPDNSPDKFLKWIAESKRITLGRSELKDGQPVIRGIAGIGLGERGDM